MANLNEYKEALTSIKSSIIYLLKAWSQFKVYKLDLTF